MAKTDYYETLGINRNANQEEIKKAYKKLAFEYHPDRNPGNPQAEEKFKQINEAYQVISNPDKRAQYDSFGQMSGDGGFSDMNFSHNFNDLFGNLFDEVFSAGRRQGQGRERGRDLKYNLELTFEEAVFGVEKELTIPKRSFCSDCNGRGAAPGGETTCLMCAGKGTIKYSEGFFAISRMCSSCGGTGRIIKKACATCRGEGLVTTEQRVKVSIPPGVDNRSRLRIRSEGEGGLYGAPSGDLYVEIFVKDHPFFKREGKDILCDVPVSFVQAALGAEIEIPTLEGRASIKVPAGTQSGQSFKLKGKGAPVINGRGKGDLFIKVNVEVPVKLTSRQKQLLEEFAKAGEGNENPGIKNFFDKFRELFG